MTSIKIMLKNRAKSNGLFPVILRVIKDRKIKRIPLGMDCSIEEWNTVESNFKKNHSNYIQRNLILLKYKLKAQKIIDNYNEEELNFSLNEFELKFRQREKSNISVLNYWQEVIDDLKSSGRIGNARAHKDTLVSFFKFCKNNNLKFQEITPSLLNKYEVFLMSNGCKQGGVAFRMREIRSLYNDAIKKGVVNEKYYPFKIYKISKLKSQGIKKALNREEIRLIENFDCNLYPHLNDTKNYFLFSYYARGMNFHDMMNLEWDNINGDRIYYIRSKTKRRFSIKIIEPISIILNYYKDYNTLTSYVFPILLKNNLSPIQIENRKHKTLSRYNKQLKEIAQILGINRNISSYTARHSFATNLKQAGISEDIIGESLGHSNLEVTKAYLKEFEDDVLDKAISKLI